MQNHHTPEYDVVLTNTIDGKFITSIVDTFVNLGLFPTYLIVRDTAAKNTLLVQGYSGLTKKIASDQALLSLQGP